jgi:hypothetical protein
LPLPRQLPLKFPLSDQFEPSLVPLIGMDMRCHKALVAGGLLLWM